MNPKQGAENPSIEALTRLVLFFILTTIFSLDHFSPLSPPTIQPLAGILLLEDVTGAVSDLSEIIFSSANSSWGGDELMFRVTRMC